MPDRPGGEAAGRQRRTGHLLSFDDRAEEAMDFYVSVFKDAEKANRVMRAMPQMSKIEIATLQAAYEQG